MEHFQLKFEQQKCNAVEHNGRVYHRYYPIDITKNVELNIAFISSHSEYNQSVVIFFPENFDGEISVCGKPFRIEKQKFPKLILWKDISLSKVNVCISNFVGRIEVCNGSDPIGTKQFCYCLSRGNAMFIEQVQANRSRFYCNDHVFDEDFDDLIFELEIVAQ